MDFKLFLYVWAFLCLKGFIQCEQPGTEFAVVFMQNFLPSLGKPQLEVVVTAFFPDTQAKIHLPNINYSKVVSLRPSTPMTVMIPKKAEILHSSRSNMTVCITSNKPISVVATNRKPNTISVVVVYPVTDWGAEYYVMTPDFGPEGTFAQMAIVNGPKLNFVLVLLKGFIEFENITYLPGEQLNLTLGPWESVQLQTNQSFSGSHLVSQEPVAVFSGHSCASLHGQCNHICVQLPPVTAWGSHFVVPPSRVQNLTNKVYILAASETVVEVMHGNNLRNVTVTPGTTEELEADSATHLLISSPGRIMGLLYASGGINQSLSFDGFLYNLSPIEKACVAYSIVSLSGFINAVVLVAQEDGREGLALNHKPLPELKWNSIEGTDLIYTTLPLANGTGYNFISNPGHDFGLATIGMAKMNSYGVPGICLDKVYLLCGFECRDSSLCQASENITTCVSAEPQTCMAWGRTHFKTFYGTQHFRSGNCSSMLISSQGDDFSLLPFSVEREPNSDFTVRIKAFGLTLEMPAEESGGVFVDGEHKYTPITLQDGRLNLTRNGLSTLVNTSFGLRILIDHGFLHLRIANRYYGSLSGVCVDQSPKELLNSTETRFGQSVTWPVVESEETCRRSSVVNRQQCDNTSFAAAFTPCHLMESGPFQSCHSLLDPKPFVESCEFEVCNGGTTCSMLEAYALACGVESVNLTGWRNISQCDLQCPSHSHYESCPLFCLTTCLETQGSNCDTNSCYEACVCDVGFPLSLGSCVLPEECGCSWGGSYHPPGKEFLSSDCRTKCHCNGSSMECHETQGCDLGYRCELDNGWWSCKALPYLSCSVYGDPHYIAFDGQVYDYRGPCDSKMISVCSQDPGLKRFEVYMLNVQGEQDSVDIKAVNITIYGRTVTLIQENRVEVQVDGHLVQTPYVIDNYLQISRSSLGAVVLQSELELVVSFDIMRNLLIKIPVSYLSAVCGLCVSLPNPVSEPPCNNYCQENCSNCGVDEYVHYGSQKICGILRDSLGPFRDCHQKVNRDQYFQACLTNMCHHNGSQNTLCQYLSSYTAACQEAEAVVHSWRREDFCNYQCPPNSHYTLCDPSCPPTCNITLPFSCALPCQEGCSCDPGYILSGDSCVLPEDCGCYFEGRYLKRGETFFDDQCQNLCSCVDGDLVCESRTCTSEEECLVVQGVTGCYSPPVSTCWVSTLYYNTFDGASLNNNNDCFYVMAKVCTPTDLTDFEVHLRRKPFVNGDLPGVENVVLKVYGHTITLTRNADDLQVDGETKNFPVNVQGKVLASKNGSIHLETNFGLVLTFDPLLFLLNIYNVSYTGKTCGLCGNANRNASDDHYDLSTEDLFSKWLSFPGKCANNFEIFHESEYCDLIMEAEGPFRDCHALLAPHSFYNLCLTMNAEDGGLQSVCQSIETYSSECHRIGAAVYSWTNETACKYEGSPDMPNESTPPDAGCLVNPNKTECLSSNATMCSLHIGNGNVTFGDGILQLISGECGLTLAELCVFDETNAFSSVNINNGSQGNESALTLIVEVYGSLFVAQMNGEEHNVWVNALLIELPAYLIPDLLRLRLDGPQLILETDFGLVIKYDQGGLLTVLLPASYQNNLCGLCADQKASMKNLTNIDDGYQVPYRCFDKLFEKSRCTVGKTRNHCSLLVGEESPFQKCHYMARPDSFYDSCQTHLCENDRNSSRFCKDIQEYVALCQTQSIPIDPWRNDTFCPFPCPQGGKYEICTRPCSHCQNGACYSPCMEGCSCMDGLLWDGTNCVPPEDCSEMDNQYQITTTTPIPVRPKYLHCDSSSQANCRLCTIKGRNIKTFGDISSSQAGYGVYDILRNCDLSARQRLRIVLRLQPPQPGRLYIFFDQSFITINAGLDVWVDGERVRLPVTVAPDLFLSRWMDMVFIGQPGKMAMSFSSSGELSIEIAVSFATQYCGACAFGNLFPVNQPTYSMDCWRADDLSYWMKLIWVLSLLVVTAALCKSMHQGEKSNEEDVGPTINYSTDEDYDSDLSSEGSGSGDLKSKVVGSGSENQIRPDREIILIGYVTLVICSMTQFGP